MKCIYPDMITAISADEENPDFPVANLLDRHPKKLWKGTSRDAVITMTVSSGGALAVIATNATSAILTISQGQTIEWDTGITWDSGISWDTTGNTDTSQTSLLPGTITGAVWFDFSAIRTSSFTATLTLTAAAGEIIQAGVVTCGTLNTFRDPARGIRPGLKDYSIKRELNNGSWYTRKRDVVRTFRFSTYHLDDDDLYALFDLARAIGPDPIAWRIVHGSSDSRWIVYAMFEDMPDGEHFMADRSQTEISLEEVL